jgi:colanic acid/amylovoran biosynthesis protein
VLVDASGFALGDQLGVAAADDKARLFRSYQNAGKPIVLLPQAFGPFERPAVRAAASAALESTDLILARDASSFNHVRLLGLRRPRIALAPDFTNLVEPPVRRADRATLVIIPNGHMVDQAGHAQEEYVNFLQHAAECALNRGYLVLALAHEPSDLRLAAQLRDKLRGSVVLPPRADPWATKALIGSASLVLSSRYHGLINALSQCVPAIGTSWSHKYPELFASYDCADALWDVSSGANLTARLDQWLDPDFLATRSRSLEAPASAIKDEARQMWADVRSTLRKPE